MQRYKWIILVVEKMINKFLRGEMIMEHWVGSILQIEPFIWAFWLASGRFNFGAELSMSNWYIGSGLAPYNQQDAQTFRFNRGRLNQLQTIEPT